MKPDIHNGVAAISLKGRDKGRVFVVLYELDADFLMVADGNLRTLSRPKKKRRKHLCAIGHDLPGFQAAYDAGTLNDQTIRAFMISLKALSPSDPA